MKKIILHIFIILLIFNLPQAKAQALYNIHPTVSASAYNPFRYYLFLDYQPQGFFLSKKEAYKAASIELKRRACSMIQIVEGSKEIYTHKQYKLSRTSFLPWQVEVSPGCKALYLDIGWEGDGEIALISPDGKRISQQDFGTLYPNILSYYAHEGNDIVILNPPPGIWHIWVLGHFKNAQLNIPSFSNFYSSDITINKHYKSLTFATYWENEFLEDLSPAKLFLADSKGTLYLMQSFNPKITDELTGYNGLAMQIQKPRNGKWKLLALTTRPEITEMRFTIFKDLPNIQGTITQLKYDKKKNNYLYYWQANLNNPFPKVLFLSATSLIDNSLVNLIVPITKNPQSVPAGILPKYFTYKYYISSPFGMGDEGLLQGPPVR